MGGCLAKPSVERSQSYRLQTKDPEKKYTPAKDNWTPNMTEEVCYFDFLFFSNYAAENGKLTYRGAEEGQLGHNIQSQKCYYFEKGFTGQMFEYRIDCLPSVEEPPSLTSGLKSTASSRLSKPQESSDRSNSVTIYTSYSFVPFYKREEYDEILVTERNNPGLRKLTKPDKRSDTPMASIFAFPGAESRATSKHKPHQNLLPLYKPKDASELPQMATSNSVSKKSAKNKSLHSIDHQLIQILESSSIKQAQIIPDDCKKYVYCLDTLDTTGKKRDDSKKIWSNLDLDNQSGGLTSDDSRMHTIFQHQYCKPHVLSAISLMIKNPKLREVLQQYEPLTKEELQEFEVTKKSSKKSSEVETAIYQFPICVQSIWYLVMVPNTVLINSQKQEPILSVGFQEASWTHLLEKAFTLTADNFQKNRRQSKIMAYALSNLSGLPYQELFLKELNISSIKLENSLSDWLENRSMVSFIIPGNLKTLSNGMVQGNAYNLVTKKKTRGGKILFGVEYPWKAKFKPSEFFNNEAQLMEKPGDSLSKSENKISDRTFYMSAEEILDTFEVMYTFHMNPLEIQSSLPLPDFSSPFSYIEIDFKSSISATFMLSQPEAFSSSHLANIKSYSMLGMCLLKRTSPADSQQGEISSFEIIKQCSAKNRDVWMQASVGAGTYFLIVRACLLFRSPKAIIGLLPSQST